MGPCADTCHRPAACLPRPRGDGPAGSDGHDQQPGSPPPPRGWAPACRRRSPGSLVSPAPAGMGRSLMRWATSKTRLPRPRGDGPCGDGDDRKRCESPPPPRGWARPSLRGSSGIGVSPAPAGMGPTAATGCGSARSLPRPRGDGPVSNTARLRALGSPPPPRGWAFCLDAGRVVGPVSPAPAGRGRDQVDDRAARRRFRASNPHLSRITPGLPPTLTQPPSALCKQPGIERRALAGRI